VKQPKRKRRFNPHRIFHQIKFYAVEISATTVFIVWLARAVWHELGH
jgi:hypothetical protein